MKTAKKKPAAKKPARKKPAAKRASAKTKVAKKKAAKKKPRKKEKRGRPFERLVAAVQRVLDPGANVEHDIDVPGAKSQEDRQVDVALKGRAKIIGAIGEEHVLVAIECREYARSIDVGQVDGFVGFLEDIQATSGIMVTTVGYSEAALKRAEANGIATLVLRPAEDEDWEGYLRRITVTFNVRTREYHDCQAILQDGSAMNVDPMTRFRFLDVADEPEVFFDILMNTFLDGRKWEEGKRVECSFRHDVVLLQDEEPLPRITGIRCCPRTSEPFEFMTRNLFDAPEDWIYCRYVPGKIIAERRFFEIRQIKELAKSFAKSRGARAIKNAAAPPPPGSAPPGPSEPQDPQPAA